MIRSAVSSARRPSAPVTATARSPRTAGEERLDLERERIVGGEAPPLDADVGHAREHLARALARDRRLAARKSIEK